MDWFQRFTCKYTTKKVSAFGVFLVHNFPHSDWIQIFTPYISISLHTSPQCGEIWTRKTRKYKIRRLLTRKLSELCQFFAVLLMLIYSSSSKLIAKISLTKFIIFKRYVWLDFSSLVTIFLNFKTRCNFRICNS